MTDNCMQIIDADAHPPYCAMEVDYIGTLMSPLFFERLHKAGIDMAAGTLLLPKSMQKAIPQNMILGDANWTVLRRDFESFTHKTTGHWDREHLEGKYIHNLPSAALVSE